MNIIKAIYPWYKSDCEPKIIGIPPNVGLLAYTEETKERFVDIRGNIKHDLTGLMDESGVGNYN